MLINSKEGFFVFTRAACFLLTCLCYVVISSAPEYNLHIAFTAIQSGSLVSLLWHGMWLIIHVSFILRGVQHIDTSFFFLVPTEWVITGMTIVPSCMALGAVMFLDFDTHICDRSFYLAALCAKVEHAAAAYLLSGLLNLAIALKVSWELAAAYPLR